MTFFKASFADILDAKLGYAPAPGAPASTPLINGLGFTPGFDFSSFSARAQLHPTPQARAHYSALSLPRTFRARPRAAPLVLQGEAAAAADLFAKYGFDVRTEFSAVTLRHAFRAIARRTHPDAQRGATQKNCGEFIAVRNAYDCLRHHLKTRREAAAA